MATGVSTDMSIHPESVPSPMSRAGRKTVSGKMFYLVPGKSLVINVKKEKSKSPQPKVRKTQ